jgi:aminoglycoside phosphotransferase (APT) family kinase protein
MHWDQLYRTAREREVGAKGYYNHNLRIDRPEESVIVRIPIPGADQMDLRLWPEADILAGLAPYVRQAPRLLHASADPEYQVQEFVVGELLDDVAPRGTSLPDHVVPDVVHLFRTLRRVPRAALPPTPGHWPEDGDTPAFAGQLLSVTRQVYERFRQEYASLYRSLKVPEDPLAPVTDALDGLRSRAFGCVHADIHRKNMIVRDGHCVFLDWELTLWGDPLYDLAVHLHKMGYLPSEHSQVVREWGAGMSLVDLDDGERDLAAYLAHEQVKSVIVDTVRYAQQVRGPVSDEVRRDLIDKLTAKIVHARTHWGVPDPIDRDEVEQVLLAG